MVDIGDTAAAEPPTDVDAGGAAAGVGDDKIAAGGEAVALVVECECAGGRGRDQECKEEEEEEKKEREREQGAGEVCFLETGVYTEGNLPVEERLRGERRKEIFGGPKGVLRSKWGSKWKNCEETGHTWPYMVGYFKSSSEDVELGRRMRYTAHNECLLKFSVCPSAILVTCMSTAWNGDLAASRGYLNVGIPSPISHLRHPIRLTPTISPGFWIQKSGMG